jgi:stage II sporulation protein D
MYYTNRHYKRPASRPFFYRYRLAEKKKTMTRLLTFGFPKRHRTKGKHLIRSSRSIQSIGRPKRPLLRAILCGAIIWAVLPFGLMHLRNDANIDSDFLPKYYVSTKKQSADYQNTSNIETLPEDWQSFKGHAQVQLLDHQTGDLLQIDLEEYLVGVVAAEMPASFDLEALKAQAVAARTYALRRMTQGASAQVLAQHPQAQLTSDHNINQAWIGKEERKSRWGVNFPGNEAKIRQAVGETQGIILLYKGEIIDPLYHASCGGEKTEDMVNVWGKKLPYLQSVNCSGHEDKHENVKTVFSLAEVDEKLGTSLHALPASAFKGKELQQSCQIVDTSKARRVMDMTVTGQHFTGAEIRSKLNLPSAIFDIKLDKEQLEITSQGYGHGVGMCQYGAADMAAQGAGYQKILLHYYKGVQLAKVAAS